MRLEFALKQGKGLHKEHRGEGKRHGDGPWRPSSAVSPGDREKLTERTQCNAPPGAQLVTDRPAGGGAEEGLQPPEEMTALLRSDPPKEKMKTRLSDPASQASIEKPLTPKQPSDTPHLRGVGSPQ